MTERPVWTRGERVALRLYNTLSRMAEPFRPTGDEVRMYVCGVTPYDTTHLGHAFCYVVFDVLSRYLHFLGHRVRYIQNITDIDNDILRRARELGERWDELGNRYVEVHQRSLDALGVERPERYPRATEEIPTMVDMIQTLIERGHAYQAQGNVYFRVASDPEFGKLSRLGPDQMADRLAEAGDSADDPRKEQPLDFLLWQAAGPGEPSWPSPWGPGRPGWHIECSAMSIRYLGEALDIHGGGSDLVYPHHECEIAQSESWSGRRPFVRFWMHVGMLRMDGQKMSKSLGNMVFVESLLTRHSAEAVRLYLLSVHYRGVLEYDEAALAAAERQVERLRYAATLAAGPAAGSATAPLVAAEHRARFLSALDDDLDTPAAITALRNLADAILGARDRGQPVGPAQAELCELASILGLRLDPPAS
ncbi:MAG TPA: cysteine--tRNA ligase [Chloroflexota bacterium]|nr:cysteine--tRNA ligase [Chloroflexota bacterium]